MSHEDHSIVETHFKKKKLTKVVKKITAVISWRNFVSVFSVFWGPSIFFSFQSYFICPTFFFPRTITYFSINFSRKNFNFITFLASFVANVIVLMSLQHSFFFKNFTDKKAKKVESWKEKLFYRMFFFFFFLFWGGAKRGQIHYCSVSLLIINAYHLCSSINGEEIKKN